MDDPEHRPGVLSAAERSAFPPLEIDESIAGEDPAETFVVYEENFVPDDIEQRLIYYWLLNGPEWAATICRLGETYPAADPSTPPPDNVVEINPLRIRRPRVIGFDDDGVRRVIVRRE
jgi:hypothetical protein